MKKLITVLLTIFGLQLGLSAQIFAPEGLNMPGAWNGWNNPPSIDALRNANQSSTGNLVPITTGQARWQTFIQCDTGVAGAIPAGTHDFLFTSGPVLDVNDCNNNSNTAESGLYCNKWANVTVQLNQLQSYSFQGGTNNFITTSLGKWYTMNWEDAGYTGNRAIFMETSGMPVNILSAGRQDSVILPNMDATITVQLSATPSQEELFYVRYSTNNFSTSALAAVSVSGTTGTADIPMQAAGTTVNYYVFSTTVANPTTDFDLYSIRIGNNGGSNYSYTVSNFPPPVVLGVAVMNPTTIRIGFDQALDAASAATVSNYTLNAGVASATLMNSGDSVELTLSNALNGADTLTISGVENIGNVPMAISQDFPVSAVVLPVFQGFENSAADDLPLIQGSGNISPFVGTTLTPANQNIRTGFASWQVSNQTATLETDIVYTNGQLNNFINFFLSSTSGTSGNGADGSDQVKVYVSLDGAPFSATPDLTISGNNNARYGFSNDGITATVGSNTSATASPGTNVSPIYSNVTLLIPNGATSIKLRIVANNNATSEYWNIDDITFGSSGVDQTPPALASISVINSNTLGVKFNEAIDSTTAANLANYSASAQITSVSVDGIDSVTLSLSGVLNGISDTLAVINVEDTLGNAITSSSKLAFLINNISAGLVISEIHYNPSGTDTLEFVEIANNTAQAIQLGGIALHYDASSNDFTLNFPQYSLGAGEYVVVALDTAKLSNQVSIQHLFPTPNYNSAGLFINSTGTFMITNTLGDTIDLVTYFDASPWDSRADGGTGYSLELCDLNADNNNGSNWSISTNMILSNFYATPGSAAQCPVAIAITFMSDTLVACANQPAMVAPMVSGGSSSFSYSWTPSNVFSAASDSATTVTLGGSQWVSLLVSDGFTFTSDSIYIEVVGPLSSNLTIYGCEGGMAMFNGAPVPFGYFDTTVVSISTGCDSLIQLEARPHPYTPAKAGMSPIIDGQFDAAMWGAPSATDASAGWAGASAQALYIQSDDTYFYFAAQVSVADWQTWGFAVNTTAGGGTSEVFGHQINYNHSDKPDYVIRGGFPSSGYGNDLVSWNGSSWNYSALPQGSFVANTSLVEVRVTKAALGNPAAVAVQFYITGNNGGEHGVFDALPFERNATAWNMSSNPSSLSHYSGMYNSTPAIAQAVCADLDTLNAPALSISSGIWTGNAVIDTLGNWIPANASGNANFNFTGADANGCALNSSLSIALLALPNLQLAETGFELCQGQQLVALSEDTNITSITWNGAQGSGNLAQVSSIQDTTMISATAVNANGCETQAEITLYPENVTGNYTLLAVDRVNLGRNNKVLQGSVGTTANNGLVRFGPMSSVLDSAAFVLSSQINVFDTVHTMDLRVGNANINTPVLRPTSIDNSNFATITVGKNATRTINTDSVNLIVRKGANVRIVSSILGDVTIEKGANVTFSRTALRIKSLRMNNGGADTSYFTPEKPVARLIVEQKVNLGRNTFFGVTSPFDRMIVFMGNNSNNPLFKVNAGRYNVVAASVNNPNGRILVEGGSINNTFMLGRFIGNTITSRAKNVDWVWNQCAPVVIPQNLVSKSASVSAMQIEEAGSVFSSSNDKLEVAVWPNPANGKFYVELYNYQGKVNIQITDIQGKIALQSQAVADGNTITVRTNDLAPGIYMLNITTASESSTKKLIIE